MNTMQHDSSTPISPISQLAPSGDLDEHYAGLVVRVTFNSNDNADIASRVKRLLIDTFGKIRSIPPTTCA